MSEVTAQPVATVEYAAGAPAGTPRPSKAAVWGGWVMGGLPALFLLLGATMNFTKPPAAVEGTVKMGYSEAVMVPLGVVLLVSTLLYLFPRTAVLGAILLTGWFGGAVATHVRVSDPLGTTLFPVVFGALIWGGLWLRDRRLRALLPLRSV